MKPLNVPIRNILASLTAAWLMFAVACSPASNGDAENANTTTDDQSQTTAAKVKNDQASRAPEWELVFTDSFDRAELGENWKVVEGHWNLEDGVLVGNGTLISTHGFALPEKLQALPGQSTTGYIRLEFEARTDVQPFILIPGGEPPPVSVSDLSAFIHADTYRPKVNPWETGYFFQFGGQVNKRNSLQRKGVVLIEQKPPKLAITPDKLHKIIAENDNGTLRLIVDGQTVMEHVDQESIMGGGLDHVGLYFYTNARVEELRVYVKHLP